MTPASTPKLPVHRLASSGFAMSLFAVVLALYGGMYAEKHIAGSPLREARGARFKLTDKSLAALRGEGAPEAVMAKLDAMTNKEFVTRDQFLAEVLRVVGQEQYQTWQVSILNQSARGSAGLTAEPKHWYERALAKVETRMFGDRLDKKMIALTERSKIANYSLQIIAFFLPFFLGLCAALLGGWGMSAIERDSAKYRGNIASVFAMLIGSFAAIIAGCMLFSFYVWPVIPTFYTT